MDNVSNPFPSYWREAIEQQYRLSVVKDDNSTGTRAILEDIGYTTDDIRQLTLMATMAETSLDASRVAVLSKSILGQHVSGDSCSCDSCQTQPVSQPRVLESADACTTFQPLKGV